METGRTALLTLVVLLSGIPACWWGNVIDYITTRPKWLVCYFNIQFLHKHYQTHGNGRRDRVLHGNYHRKKLARLLRHIWDLAFERGYFPVECNDMKMLHLLSVSKAALITEWYLHTICLMLSLQTGGAGVGGWAWCWLEAHVGSDRRRVQEDTERAQCTGQWSKKKGKNRLHGRMTRKQKPDKLKGWRFRGSNKLCVFLRPGGGGTRNKWKLHLSGFKHGCTRGLGCLLVLWFYFIACYLFISLSCVSMLHQGSHSTHFTSLATW